MSWSSVVKRHGRFSRLSRSHRTAWAGCKFRRRLFPVGFMTGRGTPLIQHSSTAIAHTASIDASGAEGYGGGRRLQCRISRDAGYAGVRQFIIYPQPPLDAHAQTTHSTAQHRTSRGSASPRKQANLPLSLSLLLVLRPPARPRVPPIPAPDVTHCHTFPRKQASHHNNCLPRTSCAHHTTWHIPRSPQSNPQKVTRQKATRAKITPTHACYRPHSPSCHSCQNAPSPPCPQLKWGAGSVLSIASLHMRARATGAGDAGAHGIHNASALVWRGRRRTRLEERAVHGSGVCRVDLRRTPSHSPRGE